MTTLEKIKAEIQERIDKIGNDDYANGLAEAIIIIDKYAEQTEDAYDKVLAYLKANVDDFSDYHEAIEAVLEMKGSE